MKDVTARVRDELVSNELSSATWGNSRAVGAGQINDLMRGVRFNLYGAGPLQELLETPGVTDVLVNGPTSVWLDRGEGLERVEIDLGGETQVRALAVRLAAAAGRRLDDAEPAVDARLRDGVRLHAVLPPLAPGGTCLSLRVPSAKTLALDDLQAMGMFDAEVRTVLETLITRRVSFLISGATGSGKTTLLAALLALVPAAERLIIIEEAQELSPRHAHAVYLQTRMANVEGKGEIGLKELVRHALRMRPDRIVLGECRGAEIRELFMAFNTGHEGGGTTLHANSLSDAATRLAALGALSGLDRFSIAAQAASALKVVIHLEQLQNRRRITGIGVLRNPAPGELQIAPAWVLTPPASQVSQFPRSPRTERVGRTRLEHLLGGAYL